MVHAVLVYYRCFGFEQVLKQFSGSVRNWKPHKLKTAPKISYVLLFTHIYVCVIYNVLICAPAPLIF